MFFASLTPDQRLGWLLTLLNVLVVWGINNVMFGFAGKVLGAQPLVYSCSAFASCALVLLLTGGRGHLMKETLRSVDTWVFGISLLLGFTVTVMLFSQVTSTEGSLLQRFSMVFSLLVGWFFLNRHPTWGQRVGTLITGGAVILVLCGFPVEEVGLIVLLMLAMTALQTTHTFMAEVHRPYNRATSLKTDARARTRVVGFVMFVISTLFLAVFLSLAVFQAFVPLPFESPLLPKLADFTHPASIFMGMAVGVVFIAPARILEFATTSRIKSENVLAVASLSVAATLFWEWALAPLTGMSLRSLSGTDTLAIALVTAGALTAAISKARASAPRWQEMIAPAGQEPEIVADSREILTNTLSHTNGDVPAAARLLDVPAEVLEVLRTDEKNTLAFTPRLLQEVTRRYLRDVTTSDPLTGAQTRLALLARLRAATDKGAPFSLLFIDLNKFKPVNDTYGHEAGDAVLRGVAERLRDAFPEPAQVGRMGGDEFCVLLAAAGSTEAAQKAGGAARAKVAASLSAPFAVGPQGEEAVVGASVGVAHFPADAEDAEALICAADGAMYAEKNGRGETR